MRSAMVVKSSALGTCPQQRCWQAAVFPLVVVIGLIVSPRLFSPEADLMQFAASQPIMWPSISLAVGTVALRRWAMALTIH